MKRWLSVSFALSTFLGVIAVSIFALLNITIGSLNVAAAPVSSVSAAATTTVADGSFGDAEAFFKQKGITLSTNPTTPLSWASWSALAINDPNAGQAAKDLKSAWSRYSDETIQASKLKAIYLVRNLSVNGQARSGMPEPDVTDALYFDISDIYMQSEGGQYMRRTYHHEYSHYIAYSLFGSYAPKDTAWEKCNAKNSSYGDGGAAMYADPEFAHTLHPSYGFVDGYATSAIEEDKAEIFAYYMTDNAYLNKLAKQDSGIACKVAQTQKLIRNL